MGTGYGTRSIGDIVTDATPGAGRSVSRDGRCHAAIYILRNELGTQLYTFSAPAHIQGALKIAYGSVEVITAHCRSVASKKKSPHYCNNHSSGRSY
eukprot:scaffold673439_cov70-Prasinocladus_malaysianus.AAC.1